MLKESVFLPSVIIDPHSHWRDFEHSHKTTMLQYLREARKAGIAISIGMPNLKPSITDLESLGNMLSKLRVIESILKLEQKQYVFFGATDSNFLDCEMALQSRRVIGVKFYPKKTDGQVVTTGAEIGVSLDASIFSHLVLVRTADKVADFHCDHPDMIDPGRNLYPKEAEVEYIKKIISIAELVPGVRIVICHPTCAESVELILAAQGEGMLIAFELEPHVLWFDSDGTNWNPDLHPNFYRVLNRLRTTDDMMFMRSLLRSQQDNDLVFVASDSACHTVEEKIAGASGIPSHQEMVPVLLTLAREMEIPNQQVIRLLCINAAKFFKIPVTSRLIPCRFEKRIVTAAYNNGVVENPWKGSELYYPVPVEE